MFAYATTPVGRLLLAGDDAGLHHVSFPQSRHRTEPAPWWSEREHAIIDLATRQLDEYFSGRRQSFSVPLAINGTPFQLAVWNTLRAIPFGAKSTYSQIALEIGRPTATRAVGAANGRNPIPIIIPCHRVIGRDGTLTGFGGGIDIKEQLLQLERRTIAVSQMAD